MALPLLALPIISLVALAASPLLPSPAAAQDATRGEQVYKRLCSTCHMVGEDAKNRLGPALNGIVGRKAGTVEGYNYSPANRQSAVTWAEAGLKAYLRDPRRFMPGTKMIYAGLKNDQDFADLFAYLRGFGADGKATR